jgi:CMP-N-acetylneuraminic acid synthetase
MLKDRCPHKTLYHGSPMRGLKQLKPSISSHKQKWVYAAANVRLAALFITKKGLGDNKELKLGIVDGNLYVKENSKDSLKKIYDQNGWIYTVSGEHFLANQTSFKDEYVSSQVIAVEGEIAIGNVYEYLLRLEKEGQLLIAHANEKPLWAKW